MVQYLQKLQIECNFWIQKSRKWSLHFCIQKSNKWLTNTSWKLSTSPLGKEWTKTTDKNVNKLGCARVKLLVELDW